MTVTVTRNPHNVDSKVFASSWQHLVVVFNGQLLDPADFYECKGSKYGMQPDGYVNFTKRDPATGELDLVTNPMGAGEVIAVKTVQRFGHVAIVQHQMNDCGFCQQAMREADWWNPATFTTDNNDVQHYSPAVQNHFASVRRDLYNAWIADYERATNQSLNRLIDPKPVAPIVPPGSKLRHPNQATVQATTGAIELPPSNVQGAAIPGPLSAADRVAQRRSTVHNTARQVHTARATTDPVPPGHVRTHDPATGVTITEGPVTTSAPMRAPQAPKGSG